MNDANKIKVGDRLLCVERQWHRSEPQYCDVIVSVIGRKWLHLRGEGELAWQRYRVDRATLGRGTTVELYRGRGDYAAELKRKEQWGRIHSEVYAAGFWHVPAWVTDEWIDATLALLLKEEAK